MNNNQGNRPEDRPQRPPMTPEERKKYEERKRAYFEAKRRAEEEHKRDVRRKAVIITAFALTFAIVFGVAAIIISSSLKKDEPKDPEYFTYYIGENTKKVEYDKALRNGVICIDVRELKAELGLAESAKTSNAVTFTADTGSSVVFTDGSREAIVNSVNNVEMPVEAIVNSKECSVSLETVASIFDGITVTKKVNRVIIEKTDKVDICARGDIPLSPIISFILDLDEYEAYMNPTGEQRDAFLLLANKENPLGADFKPAELVKLSSEYCINTNANEINATAAKALEAMLKELWEDTGNTKIIGTSGYRSYSRQEEIFNRYIEDEMAKKGLSREEAEIEVLKYSARPGTSEHQSGLCMDLIDTRSGYNDLLNFDSTGCFTDRDTYEWLLANSWKFGFILRYPEEDEDITGYSFESWHFRFVGRYHAQKIMLSGLTLEEYLETLNE